MLRYLIVPVIIAFNATGAVPNFYQKQADQIGIDATKIYAIALANAGVNNEFGQYLPWPWSVTVDGHYYQFKTRGELFIYLKSQQRNNKVITYGIAGIPLKSQSSEELWQSLDVVYQIQFAGKKLKRINCSNLSQCLANYRRNNQQYKKIRLKNNHRLRVPPMTTQALNRIIAVVAKETGVEQALLHAIISRESAYKIYAKSQTGAMGLMQLMPGTARYLGLYKADYYNPYKNVKAGANYIKEQLVNFNGRLELALAAYNAGPGAVRKYGGIPPYKETKKYVPAVIGYYRYFKKKMG